MGCEAGWSQDLAWPLTQVRLMRLSLKETKPKGVRDGVSKAVPSLPGATSSLSRGPDSSGTFHSTLQLLQPIAAPPHVLTQGKRSAQGFYFASKGIICYHQSILQNRAWASPLG